MEYEPFLKIAQIALDSGCIIIPAFTDDIIQSRDISIVTPEINLYYFYLPEVGRLCIDEYNGRKYVNHSYCESGSAIIEAGFSQVDNSKKRIYQSRLFCISGYYDDNNQWIPRPDFITKLYNKLVRAVKKSVTYTEFTKINPKRNLTYLTKEYISPKCLDLVNEQGYILE